MIIPTKAESPRHIKGKSTGGRLGKSIDNDLRKSVPVTSKSEIMFGKFDKNLYATMLQNTNLEEKTQAFETAYALLSMDPEGLNELEFVNFLLPYLREGNQATLSMWSLRILNLLMKQPNIHKKVNVVRLS